jgi:hypothetical protein
MTFREALQGADKEIRRRLDALLDSEDAIVVLVDPHGVTSYAHGFGISGCQLEILSRDVESAIRLASGASSSAAPQECRS